MQKGKNRKNYYGEGASDSINKKSPEYKSRCAEIRAARVAQRQKAMKPFYKTRVTNGMIIVICIIMLIVTFVIA